MFTVDPFNEDVALGDDGNLLVAVRIALATDEDSLPTFEELMESPIAGYADLSNAFTRDDP